MAQTAKQGQLFVISAPSGGGKSSLVRTLLEREKKLRLSISHTTRPRRQGERDGQAYHFISTQEFLDLATRGEFLEHAVVHGNHYGTSRRMVLEESAAGCDVLLELDWQGAAALRRSLPRLTSVFLLPPSPKELLRRLRARGQDSEPVILGRMRDLAEALQQAENYDYRVVNEDFQQCLDILLSIVRAHRAGQRAQVPEDPKLLPHLLREATQYL